MSNRYFTKLRWMLVIALVVGATPVGAERLHVERLNNALPIVSKENFRQLGVGKEGKNINGPSVIRIPEWIPRKERAASEANYYMYFAHHKGRYIRLAWAAKIEGPWQLYNTGKGIVDGERGVLDIGSDRILPLENGLSITKHIASPDVHVDNINRRIVMYFHSPIVYEGNRKRSNQVSFFATAPWGLDFSSGILPVPLSGSYLRVFEYKGALHGLTGAHYYLPHSTENPWPIPAGFHLLNDRLWKHQEAEFLKFPSMNNESGDISSSGKALVRHLAIYRKSSTLNIFFTMKGHSPERVFVTSVNLEQDCLPCAEAGTLPVEVLRAEELWEGSAVPPVPSTGGVEKHLANALRDPFIFEDGDKRYLFYVGGGEQAIGVARLTTHQH
jgi:hypothetical protein